MVTDDGRDARFRAAELLPLVRAAMTRGRGPPAVLIWLRQQGATPARTGTWTDEDENRARNLAARLVRILNERTYTAAELDTASILTGDYYGPAPLVVRKVLVDARPSPDEPSHDHPKGE